MDNLSRSIPELRWTKVTVLGRGKASTVYVVADTVTEETQVWKWIHTPTYKVCESAVLEYVQGHDNIQKILHWDKSSNVMVLKFASGRDLYTYGLDFFGAKRQHMPEIFLWHFLRSMAAALAFLQTGWKNGDPFVPKNDWRPVLHLDFGTGNILMQWHDNQPLPQLILSDFGDSKFHDEMGPWEFDSLLQIMQARNPAASHLKRDLHALGSNLKSMLVMPYFGGNAAKMQEGHNITLAFNYGRNQANPAFSLELAEWVDKLAYNEFTDEVTKYEDALEFAKELIPLANAKILELSKVAVELPGRNFLSAVDQHVNSRPFQPPLEEDVGAFIRHYGQNDSVGPVGLLKRHKQGEIDPGVAEYMATHSGEVRKVERPYFIAPWSQRSALTLPKATKNDHEPEKRPSVEGADARWIRWTSDMERTKDVDDEQDIHLGWYTSPEIINQRRSSVTGKWETTFRDPRDGSFVVKIEDTGASETGVEAAHANAGEAEAIEVDTGD